MGAHLHGLLQLQHFQHDDAPVLFQHVDLLCQAVMLVSQLQAGCVSVTYECWLLCCNNAILQLFCIQPRLIESLHARCPSLTCPCTSAAAWLDLCVVRRRGISVSSSGRARLKLGL